MSIVHTITVAVGERYTETIFFEPGFAGRTLTIHAGASADVRIFCEGIQCAGSIILLLYPATGSTIIVGVSLTIAGTDQCTITSMQMHVEPHATSHVCVRKIVSGAAHAIYKGIIHIAPEAQSCVVSQDDKTMLDGALARAESMPALEVLAHEVTCSHGSAVGHSDPAILFYLASRGLAPEDARTLWYAAFLDEARYAVLKTE